MSHSNETMRTSSRSAQRHSSASHITSARHSGENNSSPFRLRHLVRRAPRPINLAPNRVVRLRRVFDARERHVGSPTATRPLETVRPDSPRRVLGINFTLISRSEMAISPPRTPAPANGRAKNLSTPDILAAMMDSDSEDERVRP